MDKGSEKESKKAREPDEREGRTDRRKKVMNLTLRESRLNLFLVRQKINSLTMTGLRKRLELLL